MDRPLWKFQLRLLGTVGGARLCRGIWRQDHSSSCRRRQPSRIAPIVRGAIIGTGNDGLIQRLQMAVWPDPRTSWQWIDRHPDRAALETSEKVFRDIHELELGSSDNPVVFRLSPAAQGGMFQQWMQEIQKDARSGKLSTVLESHLLRMPKTIASLALIFELVEGGRAEVGTDAKGSSSGLGGLSAPSCQQALFVWKHHRCRRWRTSRTGAPGHIA